MPCPNTVAANPRGCSIIWSPAVSPRWANWTAVTPSRQVIPACNGLVIVPKLWIRPLDIDPAMPKAIIVFASSSFISLAQAAAQANRPMTAVLWNPLSIWLYLVL